MAFARNETMESLVSHLCRDERLFFLPSFCSNYNDVLLGSYVIMVTKEYSEICSNSRS